MASSATDSAVRPPAATPAPPAVAGPAVVLGATVAVAAFAGLMAAVLLVRHPHFADALSRLTVQQDQGAKTLLYLAGFGVVTPLGGLAGYRLAVALDRGPNARALLPLSAALAGGLAVVLVLVRVSAGLPWDDGLGTLLAGVALWAVAAALVLRRALRAPWPALDALAGRSRAAVAVAAAAVFAAVLCFTHLAAGRVVVLLVLVGSAAAAVPRLSPRLSRRLPRLHGGRGAAVDVVVVVLLLLVVPDVVVFTTTGAPPNLFAPPGIIQFHHDFLLGPTNQVLGGGTLLVDSPVSQYGVGTVYFLAAWFRLAPIGYGTYGLLDGLLTAGYVAAGYGVLRLAGASRLLATAALAVAVVAFVLGLQYGIGSLPQQGPLRFGLPMLLLLATVAAVRAPGRARPAEALALVAVGVSAIWAIEAFAFTLLTLAALLAVRALLRPAGKRRAWLARRAGAALAACVVAHLLLLLATVARSGSLPDWGQYFAYLKAFLGGGDAGKLVYGFERWSPGLPLAALYAASAIGLGVLLLRRGDLARRSPVAVVALAGLTAYGIALFSYAQNRSSTYLLPYIALPALLAAVLWAGVVAREPATAGRATRTGGLVALLAAGLVLLVSALPVGDAFSRTALAHARPGGDLSGALRRLWHPPPIDPRAPQAAHLLDRFNPGRRHVLVLLPDSPELEVEALMRAGRANALPIGNPIEESFVPTVWAPPVRRAIARLRPGRRVLIDAATRRRLAALRAAPDFNPLDHPAIGVDRLEQWALREVGRRFRLRTVSHGTSGLEVARLVPR